MRFSHILVKQKFEAEDIERKLKSGSSFEDLARKFSSCGSASAGGDLGAVSLSRFDVDFSEAAQILKVGEVSPPTRTKFGYHLIRRTE